MPRVIGTRSSWGASFIGQPRRSPPAPGHEAANARPSPHGITLPGRIRQPHVHHIIPRFGIFYFAFLNLDPRLSPWPSDVATSHLPETRVQRPDELEDEEEDVQPMLHSGGVRAFSHLPAFIKTYGQDRSEVMKLQSLLIKALMAQKKHAEIGRASCRERVSSPV